MYGVVLEGGGAKGAYQIGAWQALRELGVPIGGVAGTSIGALNGALMVQEDFEKAYDIWYNMSPEKVIHGNQELIDKLIQMDFQRGDLKKIFQSFREVIRQGGLDISPLRALIKETLKEEVIRSSEKVFGFVTVSLSDFKPIDLYKEDIPEGQMGDYIMTSANLPVFQLDQVGGKRYLDGGFYDNLPLRLLSQKGFDQLITIELYGLGIKQRLPKDARKSKIIRIQPSEDLGGTLEFLPDTARKNILMGYYDTKKCFEKLEGLKYYLRTSIEELYYFEMINRISDECVVNLAHAMGFKDKYPKRLLFEDLIPKWMELMKLDETMSYKTFVLGIFENVAQLMDLERYAIYKDDEFMEMVKEAYLKDERFSVSDFTFSKKYPKIIKKSGIYLSSVKDDLIISLFRALCHLPRVSN